VPNLAANPVFLVYGIAGLAAIAMLLLGFGIYAAVTAPQARLKRRISAVVGDPLPAMVIPGTGRKDQNAGAKRKKQIQERLKHAEEARQKRRGSKLREQLVFAGLSISPQQFVIYALLGGAIITGIAFIFGLPPILLPAVGVIGFLGIPKFVLSFMIKRSSAS
jgi:tight adherence protein B